MENTAIVSLADTMQLGKVLADSGFFQDSRQAAQAVVKVLAGRELGFGPVASMTGINIIQGRVALSANLIAAAVKRSGHYNYRVIGLTDTECRIDFYERGERIGTSQFTSAEATKAGTKNMDKFPRNMLFARAMSNGAKWYCADIFGGPIYTPDELGANVNEEGEVIEGESRVIAQPEATKSPPANGNGHSEPPMSASEAEFHAMTSASEERAETHDSATQATIDGAVAIRFGKWAEKFAENYPAWRKDGKADMFHILKSVKAEQFDRITTENVTAVCDALRARAEAKVAAGAGK
jgi:hypothetical protein